eukprot:COSAG01_NODE_13738_length_1542_cov_2.445599_2_plen_179_part_00
MRRPVHSVGLSKPLSCPRAFEMHQQKPPRVFPRISMGCQVRNSELRKRSVCLIPLAQWWQRAGVQSAALQLEFPCEPPRHRDILLVLCARGPRGASVFPGGQRGQHTPQNLPPRVGSSSSRHRGRRGWRLAAGPAAAGVGALAACWPRRCWQCMLLHIRVLPAAACLPAGWIMIACTQ